MIYKKEKDVTQEDQRIAYLARIGCLVIGVMGKRLAMIGMRMKENTTLHVKS